MTDSLQKVVELSCIAVKWDSACAETAEEIRVAYAKLREVTAERISELLDQQVERILSDSDVASRVALIDYHTRFEWNVIRNFAARAYRKAVDRLCTTQR